MAPLPEQVPSSAVVLVSPEDIYRAKAERRKKLAALPIDEKIDLIEKLHEMGLTLRAARLAKEAK